MANSRKRKIASSQAGDSNKKHQQGFFQRVTPRSLARFDTFQAEDKTNLTPNYRPLREYNRLLGLEPGLVDIILNLSKKLGRKIHILDAGCGQGVAIQELLSHEQLQDAVATCTGISLHYFSNVKQIMQEHGKRFQFYLGKVQDVISKMHNQIDLIVDVAGAYLYTAEKMDLFKLYYQVLTPNAKAYIYVSSDFSMVSADERQESVTIRMCAYFPEYFRRSNSIRSNHTSMIMTKQTERFPMTKWDIVTFKEVSSVLRLRQQPLSELKKGNAVCPFRVQVLPAENPGPSLRKLGFK